MKTTCCHDGKAWTGGSPVRDCSANDLFLVREGLQCGNCGALHQYYGPVINYTEALKRNQEKGK